ncbi:hypothetical protein D3C84_738060 [compost metagenome]
MDGSGVKAAEGEGVQQLGEEQHRQLVGEVAQQQPAQRGDQETGHQHHAHRVAREDPRHHQEQQHLGHHAQGPELADQAARVAEGLQVDGLETVVGPVRQLHQPHAQIEGQHARLAQLGEKAALPRAVRPYLGHGIGHPEAAEDDAGHDDHQRPGIEIQAEQVEQRAQADHGKDEADGAPEPYLAVAGRLILEVRQGNHLELRQHRMPEEGVQGHDQRQPGVAVADEDQREGDQGAEGAEAHDLQASPAAVAQPAPEVGRHATHQHGNGQQLADARTGEPQVREIQA